ncbi:porin [Moraxella porci]|uniref:porin n=1 Tax=Moraxella porci TaxID=1288392 RepID=UPI002449A19D|nr:porin [Moraxella porci]MDH2273464.1 porin [Moraxella porci]
MKKLVLATAVAALSVTAAQAAPTVYGKAFLTLDLKDGDTDVTVVNNATGVSRATSADWAGDATRSKLNSNSSRIGLRGSEPLTDNTDVVYQLEYGVKVDDNSTQFTSRDTYLGLSNKQYGTLLAGRLSAIDGRVDYANVTEGGVLGGGNVLASFDSPRANNAFAYVAPTYNDVTVSAMYVMDEYDFTNTRIGPNNVVPVNRDIFGLAAQYEPTAPYRAGISYIQAGDALKAVRLSGAYDLTPATTIGALYQHTDYDTSDNENAFTLSASHKVAQTPWTAYGQVDLVDNYFGASNAERQRLAVGGKYAFNRATTGHVYGAYLNEEASVVNSTANTTTTTETSGFGVGAGLEYRF